MPLVINRSGVDLFLTDGRTIRTLPNGATSLDTSELRNVQGVLIHPEQPICYRDQFLCSGAFDCAGGGTLIFELENGVVKVKESLQARRYFLEDGEVKSKGDLVSESLLSSYVDIRSTLNKPAWDLLSPSISPIEGSLAGRSLTRASLRPSPQGRVVRDFADRILVFLDSNTDLEISPKDRLLVEQFCALLIEIATSVGPLGVGRSFYEFVSGKNFVDDTELSTFERATAFLELISLGLSKIAKIDDILQNVGDLAKVLIEILDRVGDLASAAVMRQVRKSVKVVKEMGLEEWALVRLTARGLDRIKKFDQAIARLAELDDGTIDGIDRLVAGLQERKSHIQRALDADIVNQDTVSENVLKLSGTLAEVEALNFLLRRGARVNTVSLKIGIVPPRPRRPGETRAPVTNSEVDLITKEGDSVVFSEVKAGKPKNIKLGQTLDQIHWTTHIPEGARENLGKFRILTEAPLNNQKKNDWTRQIKEINEDIDVEFMEF